MDPQALLAEIPMYPACKRMFLLQKKIQKKEKENTILKLQKKGLWTNLAHSQRRDSILISRISKFISTLLRTPIEGESRKEQLRT